MGSIFSAPKIPAPAPIVDDTDDEKEAEAEARIESLKRRRRGRMGLIHTGFQGLLSDQAPTDQTPTS